MVESTLLLVQFYGRHVAAPLKGTDEFKMAAAY